MELVEYEAPAKAMFGRAVDLVLLVLLPQANVAALLAATFNSAFLAPLPDRKVMSMARLGGLGDLGRS